MAKHFRSDRPTERQALRNIEREGYERHKTQQKKHPLPVGQVRSHNLANHDTRSATFYALKERLS